MKIKKGSVDVITYFNLVDSAAGTPETGLTITNIDATYTRAQAAAVKNDLTALAATTTAHTDNKGIEVDATNAPGLYRVDWPDAAFASGADKVILTVTCSGCAPAHLIVELVDYEPADVQAILGALTTSASAGDPGTTTTLTAYLKQIINTLEGSAGIPTFPAAAVAANNVSLAETIRSIDSRLPAALSSGNLKSDVFAMQTDVITAAAWAQATSDELIARLFASTLPAGNPGEFGNTVTGAAAYAVIAATDTATLLTRLSALRAGYLDNLSAGAVATAANLATVAGYLDTEIAAIIADTTSLLSRLSAARAGYLDNLSAGAVAQASALATVAAYVDTEIAAILAAVDTEVAAIKAKTDNLPSDPADASDISTAMSAISSTLSTIAGYLDTEVAAILADTNELQTDWVNGGRLDLLIDAIKLIADRIATMYELDGAVYRYTTNALEQAPSGGGGGGVVGEGSIEWEITIQDTGGTPIGGVEVWITTDNDPSGNIVAGTLTTDSFGVVTFMLDAGTYYRWAQRAGYNFTHPQTFVVS